MSLKRFFTLISLSIVFCAVFLVGNQALVLAQSSGSVDEAFFADMQFLSDNTKASLLFVPFPSNPDFTRHNLSDASVSKICLGASGTAGDCGNMGVNFGTVFRGDFYQKARTFGMKWTLEIADVGNSKDVIEAINMHGVDPNKVIVRFGIVGNGIGATQDPNSIIGFLEGVGKAVGGKEFYAIAGPNEPDLETWASPDCGQAPGGPDDPANPAQTAEKLWYGCVAPKLATFMNAVCDAKNSGQIPGNVKLLTPAFNMTSYSLRGLTAAMKTAGARFSDSCFDAVAGNIYPLGKSIKNYWTENGVADFLSSVGKPLIVTETGPISGDKDGSGDGKIPGYAKFPFPTYDADPLDYYLQPLKGLAPNASVGEIRQDLAYQGYQAYCATPRYSIDPRYGSEDLIDQFLRNNNGVMLTVSSNFELNAQNSLYPLFRDVEGNQWLTNSIEEFWGFSDTVTENYTTKELNSAPINSLLNQPQRCTQSVKTLYAIEEMCEKLEDPSTCTLYNRKIPSTELTTKELLAQYKTFTSGDNSPEKITNYCEKIVRDVKNKPLKDPLLITPLNIDRSYRLGFLVASLKQRRDEGDRVFNFLSTIERDGKKPGTPPHEVLVVAFKLPDILTNKGQVAAESSTTNSQKKSGSTGWNDAALLTRNVLLPQGKIDQAEEKGVQQRIETLQKANAEALQDGDNSIYCLAAGDAPGGIGSSLVCHDPLGKAVVDIINANALKCDEFLGKKAETSTQINDPAGLQIRNAPLFSDPFGRNLLANLFMAASDADRAKVYPQGRVEQGILDFVSYFQIYRDQWGANRGSDSTVDFYLVYPVGYDLEQVEKTVSGAFFTTSQIEALESDQYKKPYFEFDAEKRLTATTASQSFQDNSNCNYDAVTLRVICQTKTFTVSVASGGYDRLKILGGNLGYWMRTIQRKLNPLASETQKYFTGCRTTEEFLLGRCKERAPNTVDTRSEVLPSFCGTNQLYISNNKTNYFTLCKKTGGECEPAFEDDSAYFLDDSSQYSLQFSSRIIDGATLVTTNSVVAMNPAQNYTSATSFSRCGTGPHGVSAAIQVWYLPPSVPPEQVELERTWNDSGSRLISETGNNVWTNLTANFKVKPGYYLLRTETHGCLSRTTEWTATGGPLTTDRFKLGSSIIPVGVGATGREAYCAIATLNSNMPGGPSDSDVVEMDESFTCKLSKKYNITLNNNCGGLNGSGDLDLWRKLFEPDDAGGSNKLPGLASYEKVFGRKFVVPGGNLSCDNLFPNTVREAPCTEISNGDVDGSVGELPSFSIARWKNQGNNKMLDPVPGPESTFKLPADAAYREQLMAAINSASAKHQCDPLLLVAVLHSESAEFKNYTTENEATAMGVSQATRGAWNTWWTSGCHQPPTYTPPEARPGLDKRTDVNLAVDFLCRHILWTNVQAYPENRESFIINFALQWKPEYIGKSGGNVYGQIWNIHTPQADYVYRLWKELREKTNRAPMAPQSNYPGNQCG
jgi:hypothetical protein